MLLAKSCSGDQKIEQMAEREETEDLEKKDLVFVLPSSTCSYAPPCMVP
jgi:hypothetical protein